ncbi:hypothetical protein JMJ77_0015040, partial [Colletotrichum scovillei]
WVYIGKTRRVWVATDGGTGTVTGTGTGRKRDERSLAPGSRLRIPYHPSFNSARADPACFDGGRLPALRHKQPPRQGMPALGSSAWHIVSKVVRPQAPFSVLLLGSWPSPYP